MPIPSLSEREFNELELFGVVIENLSSDPGSPAESRLWYNTTEKTYKFYNGTTAISMSGGVSDVQGALPITASVVSGVATVGINAATPSAAGSMSAADKQKLDDATANNVNSAIVRRDANGRIAISDAVANDQAITLLQLNVVKNDFDFKNSVKAVTDGALPSNTFGSNKLTATATGAFPAVDGITINSDGTPGADDGTEADSDSILAKDEGSGQYNGIWFLSDPGDGSNPWVLTRRSDADTDSKVTAGMYMFADQGTAEANSSWVLATSDPITLNTTVLNFTKYSGIGALTASNGIQIVADDIQGIQATTVQIGVTLYADQAETSARAIANKAVTPAGLVEFPVKKQFVIVGTGAATDFPLTHNFGNRELLIEMWEAQAPYARVEVDAEANTTNQVTVKFAVAPPGGTDYTVIIAS